MSKLIDRTTELMEQFKEAGLDSDELPAEITELDESQTEENQKRAGHKFKQQRDLLRSAKEVIGTFREELANREEKPSPQQQPAGNIAQQKQLYVSQLQQRAMQATGITDLADPILQLEVQRQYALDMSQLERQGTAEKDAAQAFETVGAEFDQFTDEDKASVQEALSDVPLLERTPDRIRKDGASAAAISSAKRGVAPGEGAPQSGSGDSDIKPATDEERAGMKKIGLDSSVLTDVKVFRRAQKKKTKYEPQ
jgi:hypothetical protein